MSTLRVNNVTDIAGSNPPYIPGTIVQVVTSVFTGAEVGNSSTTYVDTGLTATITPKFAGSKIVVIVTDSILKNVSSISNCANIRLQANSVTVKTLSGLLMTNSNVELLAPYSFTYVGTNLGTLPITYKTQFANNVASPVIINGRGVNGVMTIMEIAA